MKIRFKVFLTLTILYAMLIFYLSSKSSLGDPKTILDMEILRSIFYFLERSGLKFIIYPPGIFFQYPDKAAHMILYAGFGFFLFYTISNSPNPAFRNHALLLAIIIGFIYGSTDEFHQAFVPGRSASIWDIIADVLGVTIAQTIIYIKDKLCIIYKNSSKGLIKKDNI